MLQNLPPGFFSLSQLAKAATTVLFESPFLNIEMKLQNRIGVKGNAFDPERTRS
jgi:hypothetical protein